MLRMTRSIDTIWMGAIPPPAERMLKGVCMIDIRTEAFRKFEKHVSSLKEAVSTDDYQRQLIALTQAIDALQDAKKATVGLAGGLLN